RQRDRDVERRRTETAGAAEPRQSIEPQSRAAVARLAVRRLGTRRRPLAAFVPWRRSVEARPITLELHPQRPAHADGAVAAALRRLDCNCIAGPERTREPVANDARRLGGILEHERALPRLRRCA